MKALLAYLILITITYYSLRLTYNSPHLLSIPYLANYQSLLIFNGNLHQAHPSLPLYQRLYLLSDQATSDSLVPQPIRLFSKPEQMTGIIYTYMAFEVGSKAMREGFLTIGNLQRFENKTMLVPLSVDECFGEWQRRQNGAQVCKLIVNGGLYIDIARRQAQIMQKQIIRIQELEKTDDADMSSEQVQNENVQPKKQQSQQISLFSDQVIAQPQPNQSTAQQQAAHLQEIIVLQPIQQEKEHQQIQPPLVSEDQPSTYSRTIPPELPTQQLPTQQIIVDQKVQVVPLASAPKQDPLISLQNHKHVLPDNSVQTHIQQENTHPVVIQLPVQQQITVEQTNFQYLQQSTDSLQKIDAKILAGQLVDAADNLMETIDNQVRQEEGLQASEQSLVVLPQQVDGLELPPEVILQQSGDNSVEVQPTNTHTINEDKSDHEHIAQQDLQEIEATQSKHQQGHSQQLKQQPQILVVVIQSEGSIIHTTAETQLITETSKEAQDYAQQQEQHIIQQNRGQDEDRTKEIVPDQHNGASLKDTFPVEKTPSTMHQTYSNELPIQQQNILHNDGVIPSNDSNSYAEPVLEQPWGLQSTSNQQDLYGTPLPDSMAEGEPQTRNEQKITMFQQVQAQVDEQLYAIPQQISVLIQTRLDDEGINKQQVVDQQSPSSTQQEEIQSDERQTAQPFQQQVQDKQLSTYQSSPQGTITETKEIGKDTRTDEIVRVHDLNESSNQQSVNRPEVILEPSIELEDHLLSINEHLNSQQNQPGSEGEPPKKWTIPVTDPEKAQRQGQPSDLVVQLPSDIDLGQEQASSSFLEQSIHRNEYNQVEQGGYTRQDETNQKNQQSKEQKQQHLLNNLQQKTQEKVNNDENISQRQETIAQISAQPDPSLRLPENQGTSQVHSQPYDQAMYI